MGQLSKQERSRFTDKQLSSRPRRPRSTAKAGSKRLGGEPCTFECGQNKAYNTQNIPGQFRVPMPRNRRTYVRQYDR